MWTQLAHISGDTLSSAKMLILFKHGGNESNSFLGLKDFRHKLGRMSFFFYLQSPTKLKKDGSRKPVKKICLSAKMSNKNKAIVTIEFQIFL
jgi:hypothetical protein